MAVQYAVSHRNGKGTALNAAICPAGGGGKFQIWTGSMPANTAAASTGTKLMEFTYPAQAFAFPSGGVMSKNGTWLGTATVGGVAGYFRIISDGGTCIMQGTVGTSGTDMIMDNTTVLAGQAISVLSFTLTELNA